MLDHRHLSLFGISGRSRLKDDSYKAKLERAEYELWIKKMPRKKSHPLLFRLLRLLGFKVRPPHYVSSTFAFVFTTIYIAVLVAVLLVFLQKDSQGFSVLSIAIKSLSVGMVAGLVMMLINIDSKKSLNLTPWEDI